MCIKKILYQIACNVYVLGFEKAGVFPFEDFLKFQTGEIFQSPGMKYLDIILNISSDIFFVYHCDMLPCVRRGLTWMIAEIFLPSCSTPGESLCQPNFCAFFELPGM